MPAHTPRLIALDMDGTLLDGEGRIPAGFTELAARLHDRGVVLVPASGRQLATLRDMFAGIHGIDSFIAENGTVVSHRGQVVDTTQLPADVVTACLNACAGIDCAHTLTRWSSAPRKRPTSPRVPRLPSGPKSTSTTTP